MKNQYVVLTGGKNNAGDYLIKHRVRELLTALRPDRVVIDYDAWKPLNTEQLQIINESRALILAGGPALQYKMRPSIYPLTEDLNAIKVPIILMGVGWKSLEGSWAATYDYPLSDATLELLKKIDASGHVSSVRDYHTLNSLLNHGIKNVVMTGCPALYSLKHIKAPVAYPAEVQNVSFSMGVSFVENKGMEKSMKETIVKLRELFCDKNLKVVFHHSLSLKLLQNAYKGKEDFAHKHQQFAEWLRVQNIDFVDISGSVESMINHYKDCDLHIGYRVHAHILMNSWSKPSVLLNEDGRGRALKDVIGGLIVDGYAYKRPSKKFLPRVLRKLKLTQSQSFVADSALPENLVANLQYEIKNQYPRISQTRNAIDLHFNRMEEFIKQLP
ncbi:MAG: polysaccharide pyruvyl transferase family protein [Candidatus Omnitrophica bacterium]|nr:polysaccharide pyruvyl transferase family protein [Candidatus Omnitrophota bacterium]